MLVIGLTGGIGSGKSTVAELFAQHGVAITDTDAIAHRLTAPNQPVLAEISAAIGPGILHPDGTLDRATLRQRVFRDPEARKRLETILHPRIRQAVATELAQPTDAAYRMVVVPLLFEADGYSALIQRSLAVDCPESLQIERAMARSRLTETEVKAIIATQLSRNDRRHLADDIVTNDSSLEKLANEVSEIHKKYIHLA